MNHHLIILNEEQAKEMAAFKVGEEIEFESGVETITKIISSNQIETMDTAGVGHNYLAMIEAPEKI